MVCVIDTDREYCDIQCNSFVLTLNAGDNHLRKVVLFMLLQCSFIFNIFVLQHKREFLIMLFE